MAEVFLSPQSQALVAAGTVVAATGNSGNLTIPLADSYAFVLNVTAASGTTETLDCALQVSPDQGTTWFDWFRFAQVTTSAVTRRLIVQPMQGRGEAGSEAAITAAASGAISNNVPFPGALFSGGKPTIRFVYTLGGTSPSYTLGIWMFAQTKQSAI